MSSKVLTTAMVLTVLLALAAGTAEAQSASPRLINFQGKLLDSSQQPVTSAVTVTIRIYDDPSAGTLLFTEAHSVTPNSAGIYSIRIGSVTALPAALDFQNSYWVSVEVDADGEMTPRYRLTASPYAFVAYTLEGMTNATGAELDQLAGISANVDGTNLSTLTDGAGNNADALHEHTTASITDVATGATAGDILYWDGTAWAIHAAGSQGDLLQTGAAGALSWVGSGAGAGDLLTFSGGNWSLLANSASTGEVLLSNAGAAPSWTTVYLPGAGANTGDILYWTGTGWAATNSGAAGDILLSNTAGAPTWVTTVPSANISGNYPNITGVGTIASGTWQATAVGAQYGGTGLTGVGAGDMLYASAANTFGTITLGANNDVLEVVAGVPAWTANPGHSHWGRAWTGGTATTTALSLTHTGAGGTDHGLSVTTAGGIGIQASTSGGIALQATTSVDQQAAVFQNSNTASSTVYVVTVDSQSVTEAGLDVIGTTNLQGLLTVGAGAPNQVGITVNNTTSTTNGDVLTVVGGFPQWATVPMLPTPGSAGDILYDNGTAWTASSPGGIGRIFLSNTGGAPTWLAGTASGELCYWNGNAWANLTAGSTGQFLEGGATPTWTAGDLVPAAGTAGEILYDNGTSWTALGAGSAGQFLEGGTPPQWTAGSLLPTGANGDILAYSGGAWNTVGAGATGELLASSGAGAPAWLGGGTGDILYWGAGGWTAGNAGVTGELMLSNTTGAPTWLGGATGDLLYWTATGWTTGNAGVSGELMLSSTTGAPTWISGGVGGGEVLYWTGATWATLGAGTAGQFLEGGATPGWTTGDLVPAGSAGGQMLYYNSGTSSWTLVTAPGGTNQYLRGSGAGMPTWQTGSLPPSGGGTGDILFWNAGGPAWAVLSSPLTARFLRHPGGAASPQWVAGSLVSAAGTQGNFLYDNGTNWVPTSPGGDGEMVLSNTTGAPTWLAGTNTGDVLYWDATNGWSVLAKGANGDVLTSQTTGAPVWTSQGTGNGFDADTVDSLHAGDFLRSNANTSFSGIGNALRIMAGAIFNISGTFQLGGVNVSSSAADLNLLNGLAAIGGGDMVYGSGGVLTALAPPGPGNASVLTHPGGTGAPAWVLGRVVPAGTQTGQTLFWNGTSWTPNANLFWDNTNTRLGVNTTAPGYDLDVQGDAYVNSTAAGSTYALRVRSVSSGLYGIHSTHNGTYAGYFLNNQTQNNLTYGLYVEADRSGGTAGNSMYGIYAVCDQNIANNAPLYPGFFECQPNASNAGNTFAVRSYHNGANSGTGDMIGIYNSVNGSWLASGDIGIMNSVYLAAANQVTYGQYTYLLGSSSNTSNAYGTYVSCSNMEDAAYGVYSIVSKRTGTTQTGSAIGVYGQATHQPTTSGTGGSIYGGYFATLVDADHSGGVYGVRASANTSGTGSSYGIYAVGGTTIPLAFPWIYEVAGFFSGDVYTNGTASANFKSFVQPHPTDASKEVAYANLEGPEARIFEEGTARLVNGEAVIEMPEHFRLVAGEQGIRVQLTPRSAESKGLAAVEVTRERIRVRELGSGTGSYDFDYYVTADRKGFESFEAIRPNVHFRPEHYESIEHLENHYKSPAMVVVAMKNLLISNGILLPDGRLNRAKCLELGWKLPPEKTPTHEAPTGGSEE
jgi:hypothetical protein